MTMNKIARKKLFVDESRIWNIEEPMASAPSNMNLKIKCILMRYMWYDIHVGNMLNIKGSSRNLAAMRITEKNNFLRQFSRYHHKNQGAEDNFYSLRTWSWTFLLPALSTQIVLFRSKIGRVFVPKFHHEKRARNFLKYLVSRS